MKRLLQIFPIFCTLLFVGLGAFMPRLASLVLNQQLEHEVALLKNQDISIALEQGTDFFQTLELLGSVYSQVELSGGYCMEPVDAQAAAVEARMRFTASDTECGIPEVTPMLITSRSTPGLSGIFWRCIWNEGLTNTPEASIRIDEVLWLDDQSGQIVSFSGGVEWLGLSAPNTVFPQPAIAAVEYCRLYYPVDTADLSLASGDGHEGQYTVTLSQNQNGKWRKHSITMRLVDGWLLFNI